MNPPMQIVHTISDLRDALAGRGRPAFVPTMGNLHDGHLALVRQAKPLGSVMVVSIFVNRLQFLPHEDFDSYPRTLEIDAGKLHAEGCDVLFAPAEKDLYPQPQTFKVQPDPRLADILEGHFRPGFFTGVCTVVMKLLACVFSGGPGTAVFGRKDYQQVLVIRRMVEQFALPIDIVTGDTCRAGDGLALSSRNGYLTADQRKIAPGLYKVLSSVADKLKAGERDQDEIITLAEQALNEKGFRADDIQIRDADTLLELTENSKRAVILMAAWLGKARLIDNQSVEL